MKRTMLGCAAAVAAVLGMAGAADAATCIGNCGTSGADQVVTLPPNGSATYDWVSTANGVAGVGLPGVGGPGRPATGSLLNTAPFGAAAGDGLRFFFNYVTTDGGVFTDYAWARLLDTAGNEVALLFTARTTPSGSIVPGFAMPAPAATLTPSSIPVIPGPPNWTPLGSRSTASCFDPGCGYTGWVESFYAIAAPGTYVLQFGVTNWNDDVFDSGLAFAGVTVAGNPIGPDPVPLPATAWLLLAGLGWLAGRIERRR